MRAMYVICGCLWREWEWDAQAMMKIPFRFQLYSKYAWCSMKENEKFDREIGFEHRGSQAWMRWVFVNISRWSIWNLNESDCIYLSIFDWLDCHRLKRLQSQKMNLCREMRNIITEFMPIAYCWLLWWIQWLCQCLPQSNLMKWWNEYWAEEEGVPHVQYNEQLWGQCQHPIPHRR